MDKKQIMLFVVGALVLLLVFFRKKGATQVAGNGQEENAGGITFTTNQMPSLLTPKPDQYNYMFVQEVMQSNGKDVAGNPLPANGDDYWHPWMVGGSVYVPVMGIIPG